MNDTFNIQGAFALLIGVGGEGIEITAKDAADLGAILRNDGAAGYPPDQVTVLTESDATKASVLTALDQLIEQTSKTKEATVFIYYSGHGGIFTDRESNRSEHYLLTHGFDGLRPERTMISATVFSQKIEAIHSDRLIVLLDCCHAAGMKVSSQASARKKAASKSPWITGIEFIKHLSGGRGRVFVSSCAANETSVILPRASNSLFTEVTLEALQGRASGEAPYVQVIDLLYLLLREVPERIRPYNHSQNPVINEVENLNSAYILCRNQANLNQQMETKKSSAIPSSEKEPLTAAEKLGFIHTYSQNINNNGEVKNQVNIITNHGPINLS